MGTRAVFTFKDEDQSYSVYTQYDGSPEGAAYYLTNILTAAWQLPRFEPDEFAAAFIAANKLGPGGLRLTIGPDAHDDLEYVYEVFQAKNGQMIIRCDEVGFYGRLKDFVGKYGSVEDRKRWNASVPSNNPLSEIEEKVA